MANQTQVLWLGSRHNVDRFTLSRYASFNIVCRRRQLRMRPRCCDWQWQPVDNGRPCCVSPLLSVLVPFATDLTDTSINVCGCCKGTDPGVCFQSPRSQRNSVLYGLTDNFFQRLQSVENAAARVITRTGRLEHITPVLRQLHWLTVQRRIQFKLDTLMY